MTHCSNCGWEGEEEDLLTIFAPNHGSDDQVCPECQSHDLDDEEPDKEGDEADRKNDAIRLREIEENSEEMKYVHYEERQDFLKDK